MKKIIPFLLFLFIIALQESGAQNCDFSFIVNNFPSPSCLPNDGEYHITVSGENTNKTLEYSRDNGSTWQASNIFTQVPGGFHTLVVRYTDASCTSDPFADFMEEYAPPSIQSVTKTDATNCTADGSITINATGDKTLEYSIDGTNWQSSGSFNAIYGGEYVPQVQYTTGEACTIENQGLTLNGTAAPVIQNVQLVHPVGNTNNGKIIVNATVTTGSLGYRFNGGSWTNNPVLENLTSGSFTIEVRNIHNSIICSINHGTVVLDGDLAIGTQTFGTQTEIDDFLINHPNVTQVNGDINIETADPNNDPIQNLSGLSQINYIDGFLSIFDNDDDALTSLSGLENLTAIGGSLEFISNSALISLSALENLTYIGRDLKIESNNALTSLSGLDNLTSIGQDLNVRFNSALISLSALENLTYIDRDLEVSYNDALISLSALENLTYIDRDLEVNNNDALISLSGLDNLTSIGGYLEIKSNAALTSLSGLDNLTSIGESLEVSYISELTSLSGLDNLTSIGRHLSVIGNDALTSLNGLDNLTSIGRVLSVFNNDALTSLSSLSSLTSIGENVFIHNNDNLSICALELICSYVANDFFVSSSIYGNANGCNDQPQNSGENDFTAACNCLPGGITIVDQIDIDNFKSNYPGCAVIKGSVFIDGSIDDLDGLDGIVGIENAFTISGTDILDFSGLHNLSFVNEGLNITNNYDIKNLNGLQKLKSISDESNIADNGDLISLAGLEGLTTINTLNIYSNPQLNDISGLSSLSTLSELNITENENLSTCHTSTICNLLDADFSVSFNNNAPASDCFDTPAVELACTSALGVNLINFKATTLNNQVLLIWQSITETQLSHYEIEHSLNGKDFNYLGKVAATGTNNSLQSYDFIHQKPAAATHYYRLKMVDKSGEFDYSNISNLTLENENKEVLQLFPNPAQTSIQLFLPINLNPSAPLEISIFNSLGQQVMFTKSKEKILNIQTLLPGIYWITLNVENQTFTTSFIKF